MARFARTDDWHRAIEDMLIVYKAHVTFELQSVKILGSSMLLRVRRKSKKGEVGVE